MKCKKCGSEVGYTWGDEKNPICHLCGRTLTEKEWEAIINKSGDTCLCCGEIVPEGRLICKNCEVQI